MLPLSLARNVTMIGNQQHQPPVAVGRGRGCTPFKGTQSHFTPNTAGLASSASLHFLFPLSLPRCLWIRDRSGTLLSNSEAIPKTSFQVKHTWVGRA